MKHTAIIGGEPLDIEVTRNENGIIEAEIAGTKYVLDAREVETGVFSVNWNNQSIEISVVRNGATNGNNYVVSIAGRRIPVELIDARAALRKAAHHGQAGTVELRAPMPGKVVKVLVTEGAVVELNQGLLVIEAMKMQNEIKSPKQGVVRQLGVKEGAALNAGDLLAIVE
jgi:biotin carboxyl carrier protein